jgi:hypothetical protein
MYRSAAITLILLSPSVFADDFQCRSGNVTRYISVEYDHKGWKVPCSVKYEKPAQDIVEYPWSAQTERGYCEDRAEFLTGKLENWGWVCSKVEKSEAD